MRTVVRLRIGNNRVFIAKGVREFLEAVDEHHSIKQATQVTGISYPKAMRMLKTIQDELGFSPVASQKGGVRRGGSVLTDKGRLLLKTYCDIEAAVERYAQELVEKEFPF